MQTKSGVRTRRCPVTHCGSAEYRSPIDIRLLIGNLKQRAVGRPQDRKGILRSGGSSWPCWTAREFLGLPGLDGGAPADLVVYDRDPVADLHMLDHPAHGARGRLAGP